MWYVLTQTGHGDGALRLSGNIEVIEVGISFKIAGRVDKRLVDEGDTVHRGQLIAALETADLEAELAQRRAVWEVAKAALAELLAGSRPEEIAAARAAMEAAKVERDRLETEWRRSSGLHQQKMISTESYDQATAARNVAAERYRQASQQYKLVKDGPRKETIEQARANVGQAAAALTMAEVKLSYAKVYSPLDGVVLSKNIEPGEYVSPGTPVVTVADLDNIWLRAYVDEMDRDRVKLGQKAEISTDAKSGKTYAGRVGFIASEAEFTPKTVQTEKERVKLVYRIKIDLKNQSHELMPGMPADATIKDEGGRMKDEKRSPAALHPSSFILHPSP